MLIYRPKYELVFNQSLSLGIQHILKGQKRVGSVCFQKML